MNLANDYVFAKFFTIKIFTALKLIIAIAYCSALLLDMLILKYCKYVPVKSTADEPLPKPSDPLSKPVPPLRPPKSIEKALKSRMVPGHMEHASFTSGTIEPYIPCSLPYRLHTFNFIHRLQ